MPNTLLLTPTALELRHLEPSLRSTTERSDCRWALCGFGVVAAAARTAELIRMWNPQRIVLIGIAGTFSNRLPIGSASQFSRVAMYGIGAGTGEEFVSAAEMGWKQWDGQENEDTAGKKRDRLQESHGLTGCDPGIDVSDMLDLQHCIPPGSAAHLLLTACAASAGHHDADQRLQKHPQAAAEDMEGFAVAVACRLAGVPLQIVRGISNHVGNRDVRKWQIRDALQSAAQVTADLLMETTKDFASHV